MMTFEEVEAVAFALYRHRHDLDEEWHREAEWLKQEHRRDARVAIMTHDAFRGTQAASPAAPEGLRIVGPESEDAPSEPRLPRATGLGGV
jgi:23S rRNA A2030 N6-methylase RlmJ